MTSHSVMSVTLKKMRNKMENKFEKVMHRSFLLDSENELYALETLRESKSGEFILTIDSPSLSSGMTRDIYKISVDDAKKWKENV